METAPNQQPIIQPNSNQPPYETRSVCDDNLLAASEVLKLFINIEKIPEGRLTCWKRKKQKKQIKKK
jgi:hypothetical protein